MENDYDVIVVGAGPGGCAVAKRCAEAGLKTIMFEKRQEIGSPKRCGEGLTFSTEKIIGKIPEKYIGQVIEGATVYAPNGKSVKIVFEDSGGYVVERKVFDKWLASRASRTGACVQAKTEVTGIIKEGNFVKGVRVNAQGKEMELKCRVLVAADGVESSVARKAGLDTTNLISNVDSGFQYEMCNLKLGNPHYLELFMGNEVAPRGYVWIFPKGKDVANVGIGTAGSKKTAKHYLDAFIESHPEIFRDSGIIEVNSGGIPVGGFLKNMVSDGLVVVGDAAHQVNPIHGGGLKEATLAGQMAGDVIARAMKEGDVSRKNLSEYNKVWWEKRGHALEKVQKLREVVEKLSDEDLNMLAENLTGEDIVEFTRGNKMMKLGKILLKKPRLIALARKLF